jgi:tetratricopeptide (TPR) repeat protein
MPVRADCRELVEEANRLATRGPVSPLVEGAALLQAARENLAAGDRVGFERALRRLETLAEAYRLAYFDWSLAMLRGTRALLEGRFGEARELVRHQTERGRRANPLLAFQVEAIHDTMIGLAVDARESVVEELRRLAERFPEISPWRASLAMALAACGHRTEAAAEVENLIRGGLRPRHRDFLPIVLATLAQAVQRLGDARLAGVVAGELALLEDRSVVVGACFAGYGAVDRYRGLCAEAAGDAGAAVALFASGLQIDEAMGALPFVACGCFDLGRALRLRGEPEDADASEQQIGRALALASALGMRSLEDDIGDWAASQSARPETDRGNLEQQ